jgi:hypothetical protein
LEGGSEAGSLPSAMSSRLKAAAAGRGGGSPPLSELMWPGKPSFQKNNQIQLVPLTLLFDGQNAFSTLHQISFKSSVYFFHSPPICSLTLTLGEYKFEI